MFVLCACETVSDMQYCNFKAMWNVAIALHQLSLCGVLDLSYWSWYWPGLKPRVFVNMVTIYRVTTKRYRYIVAITWAYLQRIRVILRCLR